MARSIRSVVLHALGYAIVLEILLVAAIEFFPVFEENVAALRAMAPIAALKSVMDQLEEGGVVAYVCGQQFFKACNTLGMAAAILFAVGGVAGEVHRGTLEIWLARPFTRGRILTERFLLGAAAVALPVFLTSATIPWLCDWRIFEEIRLGPMMLCSIHQCSLLLAIYGVTFFCSTVGSQPTKIAFVLLFLTSFSFAIYMIEQVTHYSIFRWTDIDDFMAIYDTGRIDWKLAGSLYGFAALSLVASLVAFQRRVP